MKFRFNSPVAGLVALLVLGLAVPVRADSSAPEGSMGQIREYTYSQAKAAGIPTEETPEEMGMPRCPRDGGDPGFATAEGAQKAAENANKSAPCAADPANSIIASGGKPAPSSTGYHHNGAQTNSQYRGGQITVEVGDPDVDHRSAAPYEFVVSRVLAKTGNPGNWIEIGWAEVSWKDNKRYVYTFKSETGTWNFHTSYTLSDGNYYSFRTETCTTTETCAYILSGGSWVQLRKATMTCTCGIEEYLEVYSEDSTPHPGITAPVDKSGVNFKNTQISAVAGTWALWSDVTFPSSEGQVSPYNVCWIAMDYEFRAGKTITC